ncbi:MAG TPA: hypothetical protein PLP76_07465 [Bacteroidales bacterium]|nr:hypothetical protein [Bacteroidales bacterium]
MKKVTLFLITCFVLSMGGAFVGAYFGYRYATDNSQSATAVIDEKIIIKRDTIVIKEKEFIPVKVTEVKTEIVKVLVKDSLTTIDTAGVITQIDSANVAIPITQKEYKSESYFAIVEGYNPTLKHLELYTTNTIKETVTQKKSPLFGVMFGAGVGWTGKGFAPHVGVTVGINLIRRK